MRYDAFPQRPPQEAAPTREQEMSIEDEAFVADCVQRIEDIQRYDDNEMSYFNFASCVSEEDGEMFDRDFHKAAQEGYQMKLELVDKILKAPAKNKKFLLEKIIERLLLKIQQKYPPSIETEDYSHTMDKNSLRYTFMDILRTAARIQSYNLP